jgi:triosephosphate isomerase
VRITTVRGGGLTPATARKPIVVGNWKMCASRAQLAEMRAVGDAAVAAATEVVICPPFPLIHPAMRCARGLAIGAQDCHHAAEGAFTGSVSPVMLREAGASHVIVGHSERRQAFGESDADVCAKAAAAIRAKLLPIVCVGESAADRQAGTATATVTRQLQQSVPALARPGEILLAYEPVWAIGSGKTPTPDEIAEMHGAIRGALRDIMGEGAEQVRLLYGGSVNAANAGWITALEDVDGVLVGNCSLAARDFTPIIEAVAGAAHKGQSLAA